METQVKGGYRWLHFSLLLCQVKKCFSNFYVHRRTWGSWQYVQSDMGWGLRFCISNKLPGAAAVGSQGLSHPLLSGQQSRTSAVREPFSQIFTFLEMRQPPIRAGQLLGTHCFRYKVRPAFGNQAIRLEGEAPAFSSSPHRFIMFTLTVVHLSAPDVMWPRL